MNDELKCLLISIDYILITVNESLILNIKYCTGETNIIYAKAKTYILCLILRKYLSNISSIFTYAKGHSVESVINVEK